MQQENIPINYPVVKDSNTCAKRKLNKPGDGLQVQAVWDPAQAKRQRLAEVDGPPQASQSLLMEPEEFGHAPRVTQKENRAPTNFAAFNSNIRKSSNRQAPLPAPVTFADITTNRAAVPWATSDLHRADQLPSLLQVKFSSGKDVDSLAPAPSRPAAAVPEPQDTLLAAADQPPIDWSLKTSVRFASRQPFHICMESQVASTSAVCGALQAHLCQHEPYKGDSTEALQEAYHRALMSWQYPAESWPQPVVSALMASSTTAGVITARRHAWQEAFRGLFYALRCQRCDAFYYITPQGARRPFVAFFGAAGVAGRRRMHAFVSRSTQGMRGVMAGRDHGLEFSMPLAADTQQPIATEQHLQELKKLGQARPLEQSSVDSKPASLLLFSGAAQVQGLFDWLFGEVATREEADVPLLLAPTPFHSASLHHYQPQVLPPIDATQKNGGNTHRIELRDAFLPPWVVDRLCTVLSRAQKGQLQVLMQTEKLTSTFNLHIPSTLQATRNRETFMSATDRGALDAGEEERWRAPVAQMAGLVVHELTCREGKFITGLCKP